MIYKGYEIQAEAITDYAIYSLDDDGDIKEYLNDIDCEPKITDYIVLENGEYIDWANTIDEAKQRIDEFQEDYTHCKACDIVIEDYAHCKACDIVIDIEKDKWQIINDNIFCKDCIKE